MVSDATPVRELVLHCEPTRSCSLTALIARLGSQHCARLPTEDGEQAHSITLDQRDCWSLARPLGISPHRRCFLPAAIFDPTSSSCCHQRTTKARWAVSHMRMSVVVCHMRVLDSYSDWLWTSANTARRRLGGAHSQTTGWAPASLCGVLDSLAAGHGSRG